MCPCKACKRQECHILRAEKSDQLSEVLAKWRIDPERVKGMRPCHKRTFDKKSNMQSKKQNMCDQITEHQDCRKETTTTNSQSVYRRQHKHPKPPQQSKHRAPKTCHFFCRESWEREGTENLRGGLLSHHHQTAACEWGAVSLQVTRPGWGRQSWLKLFQEISNGGWESLNFCFHPR